MHTTFSHYMYVSLTLIVNINNSSLHCNSIQFNSIHKKFLSPSEELHQGRKRKRVLIGSTNIKFIFY